MKRKVPKVLLTLLSFVSIVSICSAQNTARGIVAEKIAVEQNDEIVQTEPKLYFPTGHYMAGVRIESIIYSPDGQFIATCEGRLIIIWNVKTGKEVKKIEDSAEFIVYSPDGKYIASLDYYGVIKIWDIFIEKEIKRIETNRKLSSSSEILYNSDGSCIVLKTEDSVDIFDLTSDKKTIFFEFEKNNKNSKILSLYYESNDRCFVCISEDDEYVNILDVQTRKIVCELEGSRYIFYEQMRFSPNGKYILGYTKSDNFCLELWSVETGKKIKRLSNNTSLKTFSYSSNSEYIIASFYSDCIILYNTRTGEEKFKIQFPDSFIYIISCSPNNDFFAFQENYDKISIYDLTTGHYVKGFEYFFAPGLISLDVSPNGKNFASGSDFSCNVKIWNIETGALVNELEGHTGTILSIAYSPDGRYIASGSRDGTVRLWCALTGKELKKFFGYKHGTVVSAFSTNGKFLFADSFSDGGTSKIWDIETGKEVVVDGLGCFLGYNESKSLCCFRGENSTVRIYNTLTGRIVSTLRGHTDLVHSVSYSPDDKYVATSDGEDTRIWEIKTGREIKKLNTCIWLKGFSLDGNYIIGQYLDGDYMKWNLKTEKIMSASSSNIEKFSYGIHYTSNKRNIISTGSKDGKIRILDVETGSLIYTIVNGKNGDYLTYTPEGFFTGTEWAMKNLVHIVDGMDVIGIDQVYDKLYRPDLVAAKMRGEDISEYAKEVNLASIVRSGNAPAVAIENLPELSDSRDVTFDICVQDTGGGIGNVSIVLNGKTIQLSEGVASSRGEQKIFRHTVTLQNGQNKIEAFAMNSAGMIESRLASADVSWQGKTSKPNLYVLTVAVNKYRDKDLWLNYCVPDAASIEESFKKQQSGLYQNVCVYSLKDAEVTKEGLEQKFKELSSLVTADDVFVFFVSGHGTTYDDGDYYFIPVNFRYTNKTDIPLNAISKSDLTKNLSLIKAGKTLMMLDTCNSGAFFADSNKRGMGDKGIFERLSRATGHAILAAASDSQSAMEGYNGHGVFTYVLLDGLAGKADSDGDGFVTLTELSSYVENQVPELSYEKWGYEQVPQKELRRQDFPIAETVLK